MELVPISPTVTMYYVYILESLKTNRYYVGSCQDTRERLTRHNQGRVRATRAARPWKTVRVEEYQTLLEARKREKQIKSWKSRAAIERLIRKS